MSRRMLVLSLLVALTSPVLFFASPAAAAVTFTDTPTKLIIEPTSGAAPVIILRDVIGRFVVSQPPAAPTIHPNRPNLEIRLLDTATPSSVFINLHSRLPGSLVIKAPGNNNISLMGNVPRIGGDLRVTGGENAQSFSFEAALQPVTVDGSVVVDLGDGVDTYEQSNRVVVRKNLTLKGVNNATTNQRLDVSGNTSIQVNNEVVESSTVFAPSSFVGNFSYKGSDASDTIRFDESTGAQSTIGGNAMFTLGDSVTPAPQLVDFASTALGGTLTVNAGGGADSVDVGPSASIANAVKLSLGDGPNVASVNGTVLGTSITYTGGNNGDSVTLKMYAPEARAKVRTKAGVDALFLEPGNLALARLTADLGADTDFFETFGFVLPAGSTVVGVP